MKTNHLDLKRIAARYGITTDTADHLAESGAMPYIKATEKKKMFDPDACDAALIGLTERVTGGVK